MTNPTPHGQVPEALRLAHIFDNPLPPEWPDMVAAAAELRRQHARIAELEAQIEALSGVQALSAAPAIKPLVWSDERGHTDKIRYITAETAAGQFSVEWKGWKEEDGPCVYLNGDYIGVASNLGGAKQLAEQHIRELVANLLAASPTPPAEQQAAPKAAPGEPMASAAKGAIMGAAYDFRDAHISGSMNLKRSAHAALEAAVDNALAAPQQESASAIRVGWGRDYQDSGRPVDASAAPMPDFSAILQREAQEPSKAYAWVYVNKYGVEALPASKYWCTAMVSRHGGSMFPLYTAPQPAPAPPSDDVVKDAARYRFLAGHCRSTSEHWGGRWSIVVDGPAPKSHDSEDDFDEAVDAAIAAQGGKDA